MTDYAATRSVLDTVNVVLKRLGVNAVASLSETKLSEVAVELLNEVLDDLSSTANWPQLFSEMSVDTQSSVGEYKVNTPMQCLFEVYASGQVSPLRKVSTSEILRLQRLTSYGTPRHYSIIKVSGVTPYIRVSPVPRSDSHLNVAYYAKAPTIRATSGDNSVLIPLPTRTVTLGLYAAMLLEENGNTMTSEIAAAYKLYESSKQENINAFINDTGEELQIVPTGGHGL
jgi:hypothetical protein